MDKKDYVTPSVEVMEMGTRESLLAGSDLSSSSIEEGELNDFDTSWE